MSKLILFSESPRHLLDQARALALTLVAQGNVVVLMSPPGDGVEALQAAGLTWKATARLGTGGLGFPSSGFIVDMTRQLRAERPDLVHSFSTRGVIHGSVAARLAGVPARINTLDGVAGAMGADALRGMISGAIGPRALKVALAGTGARVIVHDEDDRAWLEASGCVDMACVRHIPAAVAAHTGRARAVAGVAPAAARAEPAIN